jgi:hypothetical protein
MNGRNKSRFISKNRKASLVLASQGWREAFSLDSYCPHPSNHTPVEPHFTGLIESVNCGEVFAFRFQACADS